MRQMILTVEASYRKINMCVNEFLSDFVEGRAERSREEILYNYKSDAPSILYHYKIDMLYLSYRIVSIAARSVLALLALQLRFSSSLDRYVSRKRHPQLLCINQ